MNKRIIALGVSAATTAALAFGSVGPAAAVVDVATITSTVCGALPAQVSGLLSLEDLLGTSETDLEVKELALAGAITELAAATVGYITTVDNAGNVAAAGQVLSGRTAIFADKAVAANAAMTKVLDAKRAAWTNAQTASYLTGIQSGLACVVPGV